MCSMINDMASTAPRGCGPQVQSPYFLNTQRILEWVQNRVGTAPAWLVGGCVRDWLLHRESNDIDLIVERGAIQLGRALADDFGGAFYVLDRERDVARSILSGPGGTALHVDIPRLRGADLRTDLSLRDFTANAMALPVGALVSHGRASSDEIIDLFGGQGDLSKGLIRAVSEGAFADDPLRMLRAVRLAGELDFRIEDATYNLLRRDASLISTAAAERVRDELLHIVACSGGWRQLGVLSDTGLLLHCLPEVAALRGVSQSPPHYQDVFDHTRTVLAHLERICDLLRQASDRQMPATVSAGGLPSLDGAEWDNLSAVIQSYSADLQDHLGVSLPSGRHRADCLVWAALAHDWGKPATRSVDLSGRIRFLGHDERGFALADTRLRALRMATEEVSLISRLVRLHMRPGYLAHDYPPSRRAVYRFFLEAAGAGPECVLLSLADYAAVQAGNPHLEAWDRRIATAGILLEAYFRRRAERVDPAPLLDGRQIMSTFDLAPGPQVGQLLQALREAQAAGEVIDAEDAVAWLASLLHRDGA